VGKKRHLGRRRTVTGYLFISPWLAGFFLLTAGPILASLGLSVTFFDMVSPPQFVGLRNYGDMFARDPLFWKSLVNTLYFAALSVPLGVLVALALALLLNGRVRGMAVYRTIFYLPVAVPAVAASVLWIWLLNPELGLLNLALAKVGINGVAWLGSPTWSKPGLVVMSLWTVGGGMVVFLAGLQSVPAHLYEAAMIDGAGAWQRFRSVTLPMLSPTVFFNLVMGGIGAFQVFTQSYVMTGGGPVNSTLFYVLYLYDNAWQNFRMGFAAAMAWVLFCVVVAITLAQFGLARRWVYYEAGR
jgi:multiple sugar transport system permease protein